MNAFMIKKIYTVHENTKKNRKMFSKHEYIFKNLLYLYNIDKICAIAIIFIKNAFSINTEENVIEFKIK